MIRPLRRAQRASALALALVLPPLFVASLAARRGTPVAAAHASVARVTFEDSSWRALDLDWSGAEIRARVADAEAVLELQPLVDLAQPDVLVYWTPGGGSSASESTGAEGFLLGTSAGTERRRYRLPDAARVQGGTLSLFSLAHGERIAWAELPVLLAGGTSTAEEPPSAAPQSEE